MSQSPTPEPVLEIVQFRVDPKAVDSFVENVRQACGGYLKAAKGCLSYKLRQCNEEMDYFVLLIKWSSATDTNAFRQSPAHNPFRALLGQHIVKPQSNLFSDIAL